MNRELSNQVLKLNGREFAIQGVIGRGASCVVYRAICPDKTEHLLKEYNPRNIATYRDKDGFLCLENEADRAEFEAGLVRFREGHAKQRELRLDSDLKNVTSNVQDIYCANGTEYIDMTCFAGDSYEKVQEKSVYNLLRRMKAVAQVVGNYHRAGLLHLDIKPANIFTLPETCEMVILFDFDSVVSKASITAGGARSYTLSWAAPEQINPTKRRHICEATDIFAVGEMFFFQLMGRHSEVEERRSFASYSFDHKAHIFENVNPKVFPLLEELLHHTICVSVKQRYQTADDLIAKLNEIIKIANPIQQQLQTTCPPAKRCFIGRDKELDEIHNMLKSQKVLFLSGLGGIGKSELAKNYALNHTDDYDEIIFATYVGSIMLLINDDSAVHISNFGCSDDTNQFKYFQSKLEKLMDLCTDRTLFIIDNLNSLDFSDNENLQWTELLKLRCKFLFTTRLQISSYPTIQIREIAAQEDKLKLFGEWCEIDDETQRDAASKIIDLVNGHTFTIELIAKQTYTGFSSPIEKLNTLISNGIQKSGAELVEADKDLAVSQGQVIHHICMLFDIATLDDAKRHVLNNMSLVSPSGLDANLFANLCARGDDISDAEEHMSEVVLDDGTLLTPDRVKTEIMWLVKNGWIIRNRNIVCVHPVVTEAILAKIDSLDVCSPYFSGITDCLNHWEKYPVQIKTQLLNCAQSILPFFERSECSSEDIVVTLNMIGQFFCKKQYMMTEALSAFQLSEKKFVECDSNDNELKLLIKNSIAVVHDYMADITNDSTQRTLAIAGYQECLAIYDSINGDPIDIAVMWQNLACAYDNSGMYELADEAFVQSIQIMNGVIQTQGHTERTVSETVTVYTNYAIHYKRIECYEEALTNLNTAFGYASLLGNKTEKIAKICHDIAAIILLMKDGDLNRALNHAKRSLEIRREILLPDSYYLAMSKNLLARCYIQTGLKDSLRQARVLLDEANPVYIKTLGEAHTDVLKLSQLLDELQFI